MWKTIAALFWLLSAGSLAAQITDPVICKSDAKQSYALYLPQSYTANRRWPILYCYDPRQHGKLAAELFMEAAEKYGWIIAASNNTRSDDVEWPNLDAIKAVWNDTHAQLSINEQRIYVAGFSGCSRIAWNVGFAYPKSVAGVIGCSGGAHDSNPPSKNIPFVYFGAAGTRDFNYPEMFDLNLRLSKLGIPHVFAVFDGDHDWPPKEMCTQAIEWMEVRAMKSGLEEKNESLVHELYEKRMQSAATKPPYDALVEYQTIKDDFTGLMATSDADAKLLQLEDSKEAKAQKKLSEQLQEETKKYLVDLQGILREIEEPDSAPPVIADLRKRLRIRELKDRAAKNPSSEEALAAQRMLEGAFVQLSFYLPRDFIARKEYMRGVLSVSLAVEIHEDSPRVWLNYARFHALMGNKLQALEDLRHAVDYGLTDASIIKTDSSLESIRNEPAYQAILDRMAN